MHYDSEPSFSDLPLKMRHRVEIISRAALGCLFIDLTNKQESTRQFIKDLVISICVFFLFNMHSLIVKTALLTVNLVRTLRYIYHLQSEELRYPAIFKLDAVATVTVIVLCLVVIACYVALIVSLVK